MISRNRLATLSPVLVILVLTEALLFGPERLIMKYDLFGEPSAWAPKFIFVVIMQGILLFTNGLLFLLRHWLKDIETIRRWANIPHREHWLKPEQGNKVTQKVQDLLSTIILVVNSLLLITLALGRWSLTGAAVNLTLALSVTGALMFLGWSLRSFRPPKS